jgi:hypothetical protein
VVENTKVDIREKWEIQKERDQVDSQDFNEWIILRCLLTRGDEVVWTGLIWLGIDKSGGFLWTR